MAVPAMTPRLMLWTVAVVFLLAPTLWLGYHAFFAPTTYFTATQMMVAGKLSISQGMPSPTPHQPTIDRNMIFAVVAVLAIYTPGLALLALATFRGRRSSAVSPQPSDSDAGATDCR